MDNGIEEEMKKQNEEKVQNISQNILKKLKMGAFTYFFA